MTSRFWAYSSFAIVATALAVVFVMEKNSQLIAQNKLTHESQQEQAVAFDRYLAGQTDEHQLLTLAKMLRHGESWRLQKIAQRAYAINPNARDVALFASYFQPDLSQRVRQLDPLYTPTP